MTGADMADSLDGSTETLPFSATLPRYLAAAALILVAYASLHPFSGWRDPGLPLLFFLDAAWPRYWTFFDLTVNALAYLPIGFFLLLSFPSLYGTRWLLLLVSFAGAALSLSLECLQAWLPSRVPSHLDLACNAFGTLLGAWLAQRYGLLFLTALGRFRRKRIDTLPHAELGLILVGLWLLTQLSPETLLFGAGDLRHLLDIPQTVRYAAPSFFALETAIIACNTLAIGLVVRTLLAGRRLPYLAMAVFFCLALAIRTLAAAVLISPQNAFAWLTPGAGVGLLSGLALLLLALLLRPSLRILLAAMVLMAGTVLVNLVPANPYSAAALAAWRQGHFLNFNGLTRLAASLWPFLALPYLMRLGRKR